MLSSASASRFDSMPPHPPTPPKEVSKAVEDAISFLDHGNEIDRALNKSRLQRRSSLQAAAPSPAPSQDSAATSTSKKVGFSPHTVYHQLSGHERLHPPVGRSFKRSPAKSSKPLKSILKLTSAPPLTPDDLDSKLSYFSPDVPCSFAKMLHSVISLLASDSVANRLDAYMTLNGALQAYSDVPDAAALTQKLGLLTQFISRDMAWKNSDGKLETNIVVQALKLTNLLLLNDNVSAAFDADFRSFLVDRSIAVMESDDIPKQVMKAHTHLLAQHKIQPSVMNSSRADKILNALQTIEQRCSGNSVIATRLVIYQRLLDQVPSLMLARVRDWLEQTFHCMLSSIADIRGRAMDTCTKGGVRLGTQPHGAKAVCDFLDTEIEEGQTYYDYFSTKMVEMLSEKEVAPCVPRIWSALLLYFRNKRKPLEKWSRFKSWLVIIQRCLNSSDILVRYEATLAWNKLAYTLTFDMSLSVGNMKMLKIPISSNIDKRGADQFSKQIRQYTLDCYYNLLHYALKPSLPLQELGTAWEILVDPILTPMAQASPKNRAMACRIINGLCSGNSAGWNPNAALVAIPIKPEDLPRLDPRWVRSNLSRLLRVLHPAIRASLWLDPELNLVMFSSWAALMQTISDAGQQEVKTSNDLKQAIAVLVGCFHQLSCDGTRPPEGGSWKHWLSSYSSLMESMVSTIGPGHFTEDFLITSESNAIEVAPIPSTKRSKHCSAPEAPMVILIKAFLRAGQLGTVQDLDKQATVSMILEWFARSRPSSIATLELLSRTFFALQGASEADSAVPSQELVWTVFAKSAGTTMRSISETQHQQPGGLGQGLKHCSDILAAGFSIAASDSLMASIAALYDAMYDAAREGSGDGGVVLSVMEPVAKAAETAGSSFSLQAKASLTSTMLAKAPWPKSRQSFESARKALWVLAVAPQKAALFDPFDQVYALIVDVLTGLYLEFDQDQIVDFEGGSHLFSVVISFLERAPLSLLLTALRRTQTGFTAWVNDEARKTAADNGVSQQINTSWAALLKLMQKVPSSDSSILKQLEPLLVAGFASPHRQVVSDTIVFWNEKFGTQESLQYPPKLESVIRARLEDASIALPNFPESDPERVPATLAEFYTAESQSPVAVPTHLTLTSLQPKPPELQPARSVYFTARRSPLAKSVVPSTTDRSSTASGSSTPKPRLRHDDSQIQFAPIDSSPIRPDDESQHLTEHQREVTARQHEAAQMFPEMSSSPMAQSTALPRALPKRLDFSSEASISEEDEGVGTPTCLPDTTGIMSDDLPSSPTPSSTRAPSHAALGLDDDQATEDELEEPPSSPPRARDDERVIAKGGPRAPEPVGPDDTTIGTTDFALMSDERTEGTGAKPIAGGDEEHEPQRVYPAHDDFVDLPSDTILPTEQLQLEAEAAGNMANDDDNKDAATTARDEKDEEPETSIEAQNGSPKEDENDVSRIEDSFVAQGLDGGFDEEATEPESQEIRRSTRKRKRSSSTVYTTRKKKAASPFKRFISSFWRGSQQDDEDDMEEEIVVASSQRSKSPASPQQQQSTISPSPPEEPPSQPVGEPTTDMAAVKTEAMPPPPKRRPGRPRKSETPTPSVGSQSNGEASQTRSLKRRASMLSTASTEASSSFVKDTPAPSKSRKGKTGQSASQGSTASSPQGSSQNRRKTRRTATAVVVPRPSLELQSQHDADDEDVGEEIEVLTPQKQAPGAMTAPDQETERPKLTPKSILGRLRDALSDLVGLKVNTAEAREFDDVLFEFRREVFEADRRGRAD